MPAGHGAQAVLPEPAAKVPAAHCAHVVVKPLAETGVVRYEPGAQGVHVAGVGFGYEPGEQ